MTIFDEEDTPLGVLQKPLFHFPHVQNKDTYFQELASPYWNTIKNTCESDMRLNKLFWSKAMELFTKRQTLFKETIAWAKDKRLHPKQFTKAVNTILRK